MTGGVKGVLHGVADRRLPRYAAASAGALAVDLTCYFILLAAGVWPAAAAATAYGAGIAAHWLLSSRAVFGTGLAPAGAARMRQKALFVCSALVGLCLTTAVVWLGGIAGADPRLAKLAAIGASFAATWLLRSQVVFRQPAAMR